MQLFTTCCPMPSLSSTPYPGQPPHFSMMPYGTRYLFDQAGPALLVLSFFRKKILRQKTECWGFELYSYTKEIPTYMQDLTKKQTNKRHVLHCLDIVLMGKVTEKYSKWCMVFRRRSEGLTDMCHCTLQLWIYFVLQTVPVVPAVWKELTQHGWHSWAWRKHH